MSVLWALVALLSTHIGDLNSVSGQLLPSVGNTLLSSLPTSELALPRIHATNPLRLPVSVPKLPAAIAPVPGIPPQPKKKPQKDPSETNEQHCEASAWYFISKKNIDDYLNNTIPEAIKNMVKCSEYDLTGILKTVLETADLASLLSIVSSLGLQGDSSLLSGLTSSLPLPTKSLSDDFLNSLPGGLPGVGGSGGLDLSSSLLKNGNKLVPFGGAKNVLGQSGKLLEGKNSGNLPNSALKIVKDSAESQGLDKSEDLTKKTGSLSPNEISGAGLGTLQENPAEIGHLLGKLDLKLHASEIVIKNLTTITEGNSINVDAYVEADIRGSDDLLGSVTDLIGFKVEIAVQLIIGLNVNGTKCMAFEILEKRMEVKDIQLKIVDRLNGALKESVPIPLDSLVPTLLMLNASPQAEINYKDKSLPVAGGPSPPIPEDAEASLALSSNIVKALLTAVAKESSVKSNDVELKVKTMSYKLLNKKAQINIHSDLKENGVKIAVTDSLIDLSHSSVISNGYLSGGVSLLRYCIELNYLLSM
ncbi:vomeromodulin-like [Petaurus breviceps papuanus]|uniref:vomeromodulin-like n=1 Tax=Petaurus breviceps papuanus TaxID=3040969 RepID=UPI0036DCFF67